MESTAHTIFIHIYKTSVKTKADKKLISYMLNSLLGECNWTIDLADEDKVLRVQSPYDDAGLIVDILSEYGYLCEQLHYS